MCPKQKFKISLEIQLNQNVIFTESVVSEIKKSVVEWFKNSMKNSTIYDELTITGTDLPESFRSSINKIEIFIFNPEKPTCYNNVIKYLLNNHDEDQQWTFYVYQLFDDCAENFLEEDSPCSMHTYLPSIKFDGLWKSLLFEKDLKHELLKYIRTSIMFGSRKIDQTLVNCNKVLLLHGPPGTGKTSLCKALCQKLSITLQNQFENFQLVEINAHSLFSKWFSESGKLVLKLFDNIKEYAKDNNNMIFVLIDEVESLVYDRQRSNGSDPSDAIRVVNALLTQLDSIKNYSNIVVLSNSNVTNAMDNAFIDRADIKQYIGYPPIPIIYEIYMTCIRELIRSKIIEYQWNGSEKHRLFSVGSNLDEKLNEICLHSKNLSGRTLRKLPFIAFALYCDKDDGGIGSSPINLQEYLDALMKAVQKHAEDIHQLKIF